MAVFNTAKLRDILVRGSVAEHEVATEFVEELQTQVVEALSNHPTEDRMALMEARILQGIAEAEARQARHINQSVGIVLAAIGVAIGIILGFG